MGAGIVIGGIILLIIGIGAYSYVGSLKTQAEQGLAECQGILGQVGQFLSPDISQKCQMAQQYTPALQAGYFLGIAFAVIGFIMVIAGGIGIAFRAARRGAERTTPNKTNVQESFSSERKIFCRSCGKKRQEYAEYSQFCGKSSRSLSTTMKRCINCDSLTEDSLFCANCGFQDFRPNFDHVAETNRGTPEKELGNSADDTIDNSGNLLRKAKTRSNKLIIRSGIAVAIAYIAYLALTYHSISNVTGYYVSPTSSTTYYNGTYGMQIQYPSNWSVEGTNGSSSVFAWLFSPVGSNNAATVGLGTETLNNSTTNLNNYALYSINGYENNQNFPSFRVIGVNTNSSLDGNPAYTLTGTYEDPSKGSHKLMETGTIIGNKVYNLRYDADASIYSDYLATAQKIIDSLHTGN